LHISTGALASPIGFSADGSNGNEGELEGQME